jgi:hypothetical protein
MVTQKPQPINYYFGTAILLFLLAYGLMVSSVLQKSATVDEQSHLFRGVAYLQEGATHFLLGHPILASAISALPLLTEPDLRLPLDSPAWEAGDWSVAGDAFLWQLNDNPQRLLFLGRLPVIWLTLLFGALVFRWGHELGGRGAALLALWLLLLDPNVLANGRFITGDLAVALFFALTIYGYWRWASGRGQQTVNLLLAGAGLGLAGATKFNAALLLPILGVMGLYLARRRRSARPLLALLAAGLIGWVVIWLVYGLAVRPLPGGAFWNDLFWELQYFGKPHGAYLSGEYSTDGWWYYFIIAFLLKTPFPTLFLLFLALVTYRPSFSIPNSALFLLWPAGAYFGFSLTSSLNIGYRYLLPMLPFLLLFTAVTLTQLPWRKKWVGGGTAVASGWLLIIVLVIWPDYIPFFNLLAGGRGWQMLSDSNVDWGQDLPALVEWQQVQGEPLYLSYFGTAHPSAYGLAFTPLPTWAPGPEQGNPAQQVFNPTNPAPDWYAISVTNLHGVVLGENRDMYAWFRQQMPELRIGGSIFVYYVPARGPSVDLALSDLRLAELDGVLQAQLATNDVQVRWFDAATSFIWPAGGGWLALPEGIEPAPVLAALWPETAVLTANSQRLYQLPPPPALDWTGEAWQQGGVVTLLGYQPVAKKAGLVSLLTVWRVDAGAERPLKIFIHALDDNDQILGQWDGLDVVPSSWQPGDVFVQWHQFNVARQESLRKFAIGVYDGETLERLGEPVQIAVP